MKYIRYGKIYDTDKIEKVFKLEKGKEDSNNIPLTFRTTSNSSDNSSIGMTWSAATSSFYYPSNNIDYWVGTKASNYIYEYFIGKTTNGNYVQLVSTSVKNSSGHNIYIEDKIYKFYEKIDEIVNDLSSYYGISDSYDKEIEKFIREELKSELPEA